MRSVIRELISTLPETEFLPAMLTVFDRTGDIPHPDWELPLLTCRSVGGDETTALPGAAAIACTQISIILVDDMLDEDPRGEHHRRGIGETANLAIAFQSAAFALINQTEANDRQKTAMSKCLAHIALATAAGQNLDAKNLTGEENYWRVVDAKSTPFYGGAYQLGGIIGGADTSLCDGLYQLGQIVGEIIQIEDDIEDALAVPANADWHQGRNNLLIMYGLTADHAERQRLVGLIGNVDDPHNLKDAQDILRSSGGVSYAVYHLIVRYRKARALLESLELPNPDPLMVILDRYGEDSLLGKLNSSGISITLDQLQHAPLFTDSS